MVDTVFYYVLSELAQISGTFGVCVCVDMCACVYVSVPCRVCGMPAFVGCTIWAVR